MPCSHYVTRKDSQGVEILDELVLRPENKLTAEHLESHWGYAP